MLHGDAAATSEEHARPESFFPEGYRSNLLKVPSCPEHNEAWRHFKFLTAPTFALATFNLRGWKQLALT